MRRVAAAAQLKSSMATALERVHLHTHSLTPTHTYTGISCCLSCLSPPLLSSFSPCCRLSCQSAHICATTNVASHCIASHVLFLSFDLRLPADWLVMDMDMPLSVLNFILQLHCLPPPPCCLAHLSTLSELNNLSQVFFFPKMATCNYVAIPSTQCNHTHTQRLLFILDLVGHHLGLISYVFPWGTWKSQNSFVCFSKSKPILQCDVLFCGLSLWSYLCDSSFNSLGTIQAYCNKTCFAIFTLPGICIVCQ